MDSVTQIALGAAVAGVVAGRQCSPKVLLAGAALGTLPDLDVLISYGDPISDMVKHRGFSHSLFVLLPFSWLLATLWQRVRPTRFSFARLWLLVAACLMTHPMLDAFTSYGTQLLWPITTPYAVSSIFIIDPFYTVPLVITLLASLLWREKMAKLCGIGLVISSLYLGWSWLALNMVENRVDAQLAGTPLADKPRFFAPTPLNTVLWRVVIKEDDTYWEGLASLLDNEKSVVFIRKDRGQKPTQLASSHLTDLEAFSGGFVKYEQRDDQLVVTDLRLGLVDYMPFQFALARWQGKAWQPIAPVQLDSPAVKPKHLPALWLRLLGNQDIDANLCHASECA